MTPIIDLLDIAGVKIHLRLGFAAFYTPREAGEGGFQAFPSAACESIREKGGFLMAGGEDMRLEGQVWVRELRPSR